MTEMQVYINIFTAFQIPNGIRSGERKHDTESGECLIILLRILSGMMLPTSAYYFKSHDPD